MEPTRNSRLIYDPRNNSVPNSLLTNLSYPDMALFKAKSFKIGWGSGLTFITCDRSDLNVRLSKIITTSSAKVHLEEHLTIILKSSEIIQDPSGIPSAVMIKSELEGHQNVALSDDYRDVWDLCLALWGPGATNLVARSELFSEWLENNSCWRSRTIFSHLIAHRIDEATRVALEMNLPRLALLISLGNPKTTMETQVEQWQTSRSLQYIDTELLKVYSLVAGVPVIPGFLNIFEDLDWKQCLGLHFWYLNRPNSISIAHAVRSYEKSFLNGFACQPDSEQDPSVNDLCYNLLRTFMRETSVQVFQPATHSQNPIDYRLSWLLLNELTVLNVFGTFSRAALDYFGLSFASQLENLGLYDWAIFVLLFTRDKDIKVNAIEDLLFRYSQHFDLSVLVNDLKISPALIHSALGYRANLTGKHIEAFCHFNLANEQLTAGRIAMEHIIPDLIVNEQYQQLAKLFEARKAEADTNLVRNYLKLHKRIVCNQVFNKKQLQVELESMCSGIKVLPVQTPKQNLAVSDMSRFILHLLLDLFRQRFYYNRTEMCQLIRGLVMVPDYLQMELLQVLQTLR